MTIYVGAVTPDMSDAHEKIVNLGLNGMKMAGKPSQVF